MRMKATLALFGLLMATGVLAQEGESALRAEQQAILEQAEQQKAEDAAEAAAAQAYMRLGTWQLSSSTRDRTEIDPSVLVEVIQRFDVISLHDVGRPTDLEALMVSLRASTGRDFRALTPTSRAANPAVVWDADRVSFKKHRTFSPASAESHTPIVVAEMVWNDRPFYFAATQIERGALARYSQNRSLAQDTIAQVVSRFTRDMPPLFFAISTVSDPTPEAMTWLQPHVAPILKTGGVNLRNDSARPDNIMTNYRRPVRTGAYPYHKALALSDAAAAQRGSPRMPVIVLTNLAD